MKKITTILTALILMFTLTFTTGCKKDGGTDPNKTTKDFIVEKDWVADLSNHTNGTVLRINQNSGLTDTINVSFEDNLTLTISSLNDGRIIFEGLPNPNENLIFQNSYYTNVDSVNVNFEVGGRKIGKMESRIYNFTYNLLLDRNSKTLNGIKIESSKNNSGGNPSLKDTTPITLSIK